MLRIGVGIGHEYGHRDNKQNGCGSENSGRQGLHTSARGRFRQVLPISATQGFPCLPRRPGACLVASHHPDVPAMAFPRLSRRPAARGTGDSSR
jgi:hypothetical protein